MSASMTETLQEIEDYYIAKGLSGESLQQSLNNDKEVVRLIKNQLEVEWRKPLIEKLD